MEPTASAYVANTRLADYDVTAQPWIVQNNVVRVSQVKSRFEGRFFYGLNNDFWQPAKNVNGTRIYNAQENGVNIGIGSTAGDAYYDITKNVFFYQPDTVIHAATAIVMGTDAGVRRLWGIGTYSGGDIQDGFFIRSEGTEIQFVKRSSVSGTPVEFVHPRSQWIDPADGTGYSGLKLDFDSIQMLEITFAWYGAGTAFLMARVDGKTYVLDKFSGSNNGTQTAIIANPNVSVIYGVEALEDLPGPVEFPHWGVSVSVDGANEETGKAFGVTSGPKTVTGGAWTPVLSIRLKSTFAIDGATPKPNLLGYITRLISSCYSTGRDSEIALVRSTALTGAVWADIPDINGVGVTDSMVEYDISATAYSAGLITYPRAVADGNNIEIHVLEQDIIAIDSLNTASTILSLAARPTAGGNAKINGAFSWREVY